MRTNNSSGRRCIPCSKTCGMRLFWSPVTLSSTVLDNNDRSKAARFSWPKVLMIESVSNDLRSRLGNKGLEAILSACESRI